MSDSDLVERLEESKQNVARLSEDLATLNSAYHNVGLFILHGAPRICTREANPGFGDRLGN